MSADPHQVAAVVTLGRLNTYTYAEIRLAGVVYQALNRGTLYLAPVRRGA